MVPTVPVRLPERVKTKVTAEALLAARRLHAKKTAAKALSRVFNLILQDGRNNVELPTVDPPEIKMVRRRGLEPLRDCSR